MKQMFLDAKRFALTAVGCLSAFCSADVCGGVISVLPEPAADGVYELGNPTFYEDCKNSDIVGDAVIKDQNMRQDQWLGFKRLPFLGYIDWENLKVPAGATVRFVGGILLDALPPDYIYDWSAVTHICVISDLSPTCETLCVPRGVSLRLPAVNLTKSEDGKNFVLAPANDKAERGFHTDLHLDGALYAGDGAKEFSLCGSLTGTGELWMENFDTARTFLGTVDFGGTVNFGASQKWQRIKMFPSEKESIVKNLNMAWLESGRKTFEYAPRLAPGEAGVCHVTNDFNTSAGGLADTGVRRNGNVLQVYSNNTIHVKTYRSGIIHLVADPNVENPTFEHGVGNVVFDKIGHSGNVTVYPSANLNLTIHAVHWARHAAIDYTAESNKVNMCMLDFSRQNDAASLLIRGYSPAFLPRKILADVNRLDITTNVVLDCSWKFPFDFASEDTEEINPWRCESMGVLQVPEAGTIEISATGGRPVTGVYPLMTCTSGGEVLADWTVNFTGKWYGAERTVLVDETGIRLAVKAKKGTAIILR